MSSVFVNLGPGVGPGVGPDFLCLGLGFPCNPLKAERNRRALQWRRSDFGLDLGSVASSVGLTLTLNPKP